MYSTIPKHPARPLLTLLLVLGLPLALACAPGGEEGEATGEDASREDAAEEAPAGERVESGGLGIALAAVPAGFEVETNEGEELVLVNMEGGGTLSFVMTPLQSAGVNLQARVWEEKERVEGMPGGVYRGQNELGGVPLGTTYTSRGRFENEAGEAVEEYRALLVHPTQNRALILDYEYPVPEPGSEEGSTRLEDLMRVLEQVEPLAVSDAEAPAPEDAPMGEPMEETPGDVEDAGEGEGDAT
jgi:hypothetical protein